MNVLSLVTTRRPFYNDQVAALERAGVDVETVTVPGRFAPADAEGRSVADYLRFYPTVLRRSFDSFDLVHANNGLTAPHAVAQPNLPVVLTFWGADVLGRAYRKDLASRACAGVAEEVIVRSDEMREALGDGVHVIPHGVDLSAFEPMDRSAAREAVGWDHDARHVLFPYPPERTEKNYPLAKRVTGQVDGRATEDVRLQVVSGRPHERMPLYLNAADALLLASDFEGSPNVVKEALACDLPVVSTDVGDVRERLAGVEPSAVCASESALVAGLAAVLDADARANGREAVSHLGLREMGERIHEVYRAALEG